MFITFSPFLGNGCKVKWRFISLTLTVTIISNWSLNVKYFSGAIYYIFILSWGFLISGFDPTIVLQCRLRSRLVTQTLDRT